jgi:hypothetical protein
VKRLAAMNCPIYMIDHYDDIPNSVAYPLQAMDQMFANPTPGAKSYFTNSISYMIALAIAERFEEIHIYGVDMAHDTEYATQRPSCEYFVGWAQALGIKVYIPPESDLMKTLFHYGYETEAQQVFFEKLNSRKQDLRNKLANIERQRAETDAAYHQFSGALQDLDHISKIWAPSAGDAGKG